MTQSRNSVNGRLFRLAPITLLFGVQAGIMAVFGMDGPPAFLLTTVVLLMSIGFPLLRRQLLPAEFQGDWEGRYIGAALSSFVSAFSALGAGAVIVFAMNAWQYHADISWYAMALSIGGSAFMTCLMLWADIAVARIAFNLTNGQAVFGAVFHAAVIGYMQYGVDRPWAPVRDLSIVAAICLMLCLAAVLRGPAGEKPSAD